MRLRDNPARLAIETYPQRIQIRASFGDIDSFQHVNNVAIAGFFEEGRATMNIGLFGADAIVHPSDGVQLLFVSVSIEYLAQTEYPGEVTVATGLSNVGRSSFVQSGALFQNGRCVALCDAVSVYAEDGKANPLPESVRARMEPLRLNL